MGNLRTYRQTLRGYQAYGIRNWETGIFLFLNRKRKRKRKQKLTQERTIKLFTQKVVGHLNSICRHHVAN